MKVMTRVMALLLLAAAWTAPALAADYTEGSVVQVASIKVEAGHRDEYIAYLQSTWKKNQETLKAAGLILSYAVYETRAKTPNDANFYLTTEYANMAALDGLEARTDAAVAKAGGANRAIEMEAMVKRNAYRTVLGTELIRTLKLN